MPNLLIIGETNNGKTAIVRRFRRLHPDVEGPGGESVHIPVLVSQAPPAPDETRFYTGLLGH